jgi:opacity protein-like surface antigen
MGRQFVIKNVLGVATLAAAAAAGPAAAQYASTDSEGSWAGGYVGVMFGVNKTEADGGYSGVYPGLPPSPPPGGGPPPPPGTSPPPPGTSPPPPGGPTSPPPGSPSVVTAGSAESNGAAEIGVLGGYDWQRGRWVLGVQGDLLYQRHGEIAFSQIAGTAVQDELAVDWRGHALVRYGRDINGWLLYLSGGAALANISASHVGYVTPTELFEWRETDVRIGYSYGIGAETQLGDGWSLRADYLYDYWDAERYDWVPGQRYSDIAVTIDEVRISISRRY